MDEPRLPASLSRHEVYDTKADVWSWGVLLSECIMCMMPYGHTYMTPVQVGRGMGGGRALHRSFRHPDRRAG